MQPLIAARAVLALCLLAAGVAGCAIQTPPNSQTTSAAPQLKPGEVQARMNGQLGMYGGIAKSGH